jgi:ABC-type dipeptide/oligopeptide/nickel transport system permease subunit
VPVLFGVTLLVFLMAWVTPGDPVIAMLGEASQGISPMIFPGLAVSLTVLGFNLLGDALRDALDPKA